jgi:hypothetical protein
MKIRHIYLTAMLAAAPAAVAAILAATPTASPADVQPSFNAALHNVPLDPCDLGGDCNIPGIPGNVDRPDVPDVNVPNVNVPDINPPNINVPHIGR